MKTNVFGRGIQNPVYRLADFYTAFYFHFINEKSYAKAFGSRSTHLPGREAWEELAFEQLCLAHEEQIEEALDINVLTYVSTWSTKGDANRNIPPEQLALVLDCYDDVIHLCEIKFLSAIHTITKDMEDALRRKMDSFRAMTGTKKALQLTMITPFGVKVGANSIIANQVTLDDLFKQ